MADWIFSSEKYTKLYHQYFAEFLSSTDFAAMIDTTAELIAPYVEKDATKFYSYEAFETGVAALRKFCLLRAESIQSQLDGIIPSTDEGQSADSTALIDVSDLNLSDMGSMNMGGMGFGMGGNRGGRASRSAEEQPDADTLAVTVSQQQNMLTLLAENRQPQDLPELPDGGVDRRDMQQRPGGGSANGETSQMPGGGFTDGEMPQLPSEDFMRGGNGRGENQFMQRGQNQNGAQGNAAGTSSSAISQNDLIMVGVSVLFLLAGLLFAFKVKH